MRFDACLFARGLCVSRAKAKEMILSGAALVNGVTVRKPSFDVPLEASVEVLENALQKYVGRGGLKLEAALTGFCLSPAGLICLDVGASSGGFTDCLLQKGAKAVYAVDAGEGQLAPSLRADKRVLVYEKYNARYMKPADFPQAPEFAVMDVSFISQTVLFPALADVLPLGGKLVSLVKPQFEVGKGHVGKGGIVKDKKAVLHALVNVKAEARRNGFSPEGEMPSPLPGGDGNQEYLFCFTLTEKARKEAALHEENDSDYQPEQG